MDFNKICIVGLGLIGGSLAKAIKRNNPKSFIRAVDLNDESLKDALSHGIIDEIAPDPIGGVHDADLIFLCTPVHTIAFQLGIIAPFLKKGALVTDVGSTKKEIMKNTESICSLKERGAFFIGGHPMAGTEHSGYGASLPHLFENAYYILTPPDSTPIQRVKPLESLLSSIGALPIIMSPKEHDRVVGAVSHLPHVVAASLVNAVEVMEDSSNLFMKLAAGGFRDITRIASSNPNMWRNICLENKEELISHIDLVKNNLFNFSNLLLKDDGPGIEAFFAKAKAYREDIPDRQNLSPLAYYDLYVDVEDRPGVIGDITTILGKYSINIKNLRIIHSREGEPGSLVVTFLDPASLRGAKKILEENSYKAFIQ